MKAIYATLKSWWPSIAGAASVLFTYFLPALQAAISAHPKTTAAVSGVGWIVAHLKQSPIAPKV